MKTKRCTKCKKVKSASEFHKNKNTKDGFTYWCKPCCRRGQDRWIVKQPKGYSKKYQIKTRYGITLEQHKEMYVQQNGCCAICDKPIPYNKVHTDHQHSNGKVRALLCVRCNTMLGLVESAPELIQRIFKYIEKYK